MENNLTQSKQHLDELKTNFDKETKPFQTFVIVHDYIDEINNSKYLKGFVKEINNDMKKYLDTLKDLPKTENKLNEDNKLKIFFNQFSSPSVWPAYATLYSTYEIIEILKKSKKEIQKWIKEMSEKISLNEDPNYFDNQYKRFIGIFLDIFHNKIINELDMLILINNSNKNKKAKPHFNETSSMLIINGIKIKIKRQNKNTIEHDLLRYIFKNERELKNEFFYSEMADEVFDDEGYHDNKNSWRKYRDACENINRKVNDKIGKKDFLIFGNSKQGTMTINPEYF